MANFELALRHFSILPTTIPTGIIANEVRPAYSENEHYEAGIFPTQGFIWWLQVL